MNNLAYHAAEVHRKDIEEVLKKHGWNQVAGTHLWTSIDNERNDMIAWVTESWVTFYSALDLIVHSWQTDLLEKRFYTDIREVLGI